MTDSVAEAPEPSTPEPSTPEPIVAESTAVEHVAQSQNTTEPAAHEPRRRAARWLWIAVLSVFALLYAWDVWESIENLLVLPGEQDRFGLPVPWSALIAGVVIPPAVFFVALALGRRRGIGQRSALLLAGLCLIAVLTLSLTAYVRAGGL